MGNRVRKFVQRSIDWPSIYFFFLSSFFQRCNCALLLHIGVTRMIFENMI